MEARRRASKRRYAGLSVFGGGAPPPPPSFFAWCGFGSPCSPSWSYQPPSSSTAKEPLNLPFEVPNPPPLPPSTGYPIDPSASLSQLPPSVPDDSNQLVVIKQAREKAGNPKKSFRDLDECITIFKEEACKTMQPAVLRRLFQRTCPDPTLRVKFSQLALEHLLQIGWASPKRMRHFLSHATMNPPGTGNMLTVLRFLHSSQSPETYRSEYLGFVFSIASMAKDQRLDASEILDILDELAAAPAQMLSDGERAAIYQALWELCSLSQEAATVPSFGREFLMRIAQSYDTSFGSIEAGAYGPEPLLGHLIGLVERPAFSEQISLEQLASLLRCLPEHAFLSWVEYATIYLLKDKVRRTETIPGWLQKLARFSSNQHLSKRVLGVVYPFLVTHNVALADIQDHLNTLDRDDALMIVLQHWVLKDMRRGILNSTDSALIDDQVFARFVEQFRQSLAKLRFFSLQAILEHLLVQMQANLPTQQSANHIVEFAYRYETPSGPKVLLKVLKSVHRRNQLDPLNAIDLDPTLLYGILLELKDAAPFAAFQLCDLIDSMGLEPDPNFPLSTIRHNLNVWKDVSSIRRSADRFRLLPPAYVNMPSDSVLNIKNELVHQIAYQYSIGNRRSVKATGRSICRLYRYLKKENLPIGHLMTKALVNVFVIRALREKRWVTTLRYAWIRRLVTKTEGEAARNRLDRIFRDWRGELIALAKRRLEECGDLNSPAHVSTMRRLGLLETWGFQTGGRRRRRRI